MHIRRSWIEGPDSVRDYKIAEILATISLIEKLFFIRIWQYESNFSCMRKVRKIYALSLSRIFIP